MSSATEITVTLNDHAKDMILRAYTACVPGIEVYRDKLQKRTERLKRLAPYLGLRAARRIYSKTIRFHEDELVEIYKRIAETDVEIFMIGDLGFWGRLRTKKTLKGLLTKLLELEVDCESTKRKLKRFRSQFDHVWKSHENHIQNHTYGYNAEFDAKNRPAWAGYFKRLENLAKMIQTDRSSELTVTVYADFWTFVNKASDRDWRG